MLQAGIHKGIRHFMGFVHFFCIYAGVAGKIQPEEGPMPYTTVPE